RSGGGGRVGPASSGACRLAAVNLGWTASRHTSTPSAGHHKVMSLGGAHRRKGWFGSEVARLGLAGLMGPLVFQAKALDGLHRKVGFLGSRGGDLEPQLGL